MVNNMAETPYEFLRELEHDRNCRRREVWKRGKRVQLREPLYGTNDHLLCWKCINARHLSPNPTGERRAE